MANIKPLKMQKSAYFLLCSFKVIGSKKEKKIHWTQNLIQFDVGRGELMKPVKGSSPRTDTQM